MSSQITSILWVISLLEDAHDNGINIKSPGNNYKLRSIWWGLLYIIYLLFSFWGIFINKTPEIFIGVIVATFCVINESFIEICSGVGLNDNNLMLYMSIWSQFILTIILLIQLINWKQDIISINSSFFKPRKTSIGAVTNMLTDNTERRPSYTSMQNNDDIFIISPKLRLTDHSLADIDQTIDNTINEM